MKFKEVQLVINHPRIKRAYHDGPKCAITLSVTVPDHYEIATPDRTLLIPVAQIMFAVPLQENDQTISKRPTRRSKSTE